MLNHFLPNFRSYTNFTQFLLFHFVYSLPFHISITISPSLIYYVFRCSSRRKTPKFRLTSCGFFFFLPLRLSFCNEAHAFCELLLFLWQYFIIQLVVRLLNFIVVRFILVNITKTFIRNKKKEIHITIR